MSLSSTITKIWTKVHTTWVAVETEIDNDVKAVKAALPSSALPAFEAVVSDLKQNASDALSAADSALIAAAPIVIRSGEALLDQAMATYTNGLALPLVPATNKAVDDLAAAAVGMVNSWVLKTKAQLAANNVPAGAPQPQTQAAAPLAGAVQAPGTPAVNPNPPSPVQQA